MEEAENDSSDSVLLMMIMMMRLTMVLIVGDGGGDGDDAVFVANCCFARKLILKLQERQYRTCAYGYEEYDSKSCLSQLTWLPMA